MKQTTFILIGVLLAFVFYQDVMAGNFSNENLTHATLSDMLQKSKEYCRRLENAIFDFVCTEEISEKIDFSRDLIREQYSEETGFFIAVPLHSIKKNSYVYDYQLIHDGSKTKEKRTLLKENGVKKKEENATLKALPFYYENVVFGPLGLLNGLNQDYHEYRILKEETLHQEKTVVIEARPKPSIKRIHLYGKIWLKKTDSSILKIEWDQKSLPNFPFIDATAKRYNAEPAITLISEYGIEKNGIRFPNQFYIEEAYIFPNGKKFIKSETRVNYKDYKFFTVETEIKY